MEKILIDDLISIIYAHHKKVNHYAVEQNHEACQDLKIRVLMKRLNGLKIC